MNYNIIFILTFNLNMKDYTNFNEDNQKEVKLTFDIEEPNNNEKSLVNKIIDDIGFTKYHTIVFLVLGLVLISNGIQIAMQAYLLSAIDQTIKLSEYQLAYINSAENLGSTLSYLSLLIIVKFINYKRIIQVFIIVLFISTSISLFLINFTLAVILRFVIGYSTGIIDIVAYILLIEIISTKVRGFVSSIILIFFPIGLLFGAFLGYLLVDDDEVDFMRNYHRLVIIPFIIILAVLVLVFFVQESPRSLLVKSQGEKGAKVLERLGSTIKSPNKGRRSIKEKSIKDNLQKIKTNLLKSATMNRDNDNVSMHSITSVKSSIVDKAKSIFSDSMLKYTLVIWILVFFSGIIYNGTAFILPTNAPTFNKKSLKDYIIAVGIEIPSNIVGSFMIENKRIGRLLSLRISLVLCFLSNIMMLFLKDDIILAVFVKFFITISLTTLIVYSSEIYNTSLRAFSVSLVSFWKRISIVISPIIVSHFHKGLNLPYNIIFLLFGVCAIGCFGLSFTLTIETKDKPLDQMEIGNITSKRERSDSEIMK